jgi:hypothetical protein
MLALAALAAWNPAPLDLNYRVAAGQVITVRFSPAASQPPEEPVAVEMAPPNPEPASQSPEAAKSVEVERQLPEVEIAELIVRVEAPASDAPTEQPRVRLPTADQPPDQRADARAGPPQRWPKCWNSRRESVHVR